MADHAELEKRISRLEAEAGIADLLSIYCHSLDSGDSTTWSELYTVDGVFTARDRNGAEVARVEGQEALLAFASGHSRSPARWHEHVTSVPVIAFREGGASVKSYGFIIGETDDQVPSIGAFSRYLDELVCEADGAWRFRERAIEIVATGEGMPTFDPETLMAGAWSSQTGQ